MTEEKTSCCGGHTKAAAAAVAPVVVKSSCCGSSAPTHKVTPSCCGGGGETGHKRRFDYILWGSLAVVVPLYLAWLVIPETTARVPWLATMAHTTHQMLHAMWWGVVLGAIFIGLIAKVPREFVSSILGQGGTVAGLLRATGAGVLLDLCSHGILMVGTKLYERGASTGQVMAFLLASPWNSFSLTLIMIGLIGWAWTLTFIVLSMVIALMTGWIFDRLVARDVLPANPNAVAIPTDFSFWREAKVGIKATRFDAEFFKDVIINGVRDSRMVVRWLLLGIVLAALLRAVFNPDQFSSLFGPTVLGLMLTIGLATVLEVCSEGSTPIATDLLTRAGAPGNSFAFLMAGVATDYTEVMVLKDTTRSWKTALFLPLITVPQVVVVAALVNMLAT